MPIPRESARRHLPRRFVCFAAALLLAGCSVPPAYVTLDPAATFTAHLEPGGLVIDRCPDGRSAHASTAWLPFADDAEIDVESRGTTVAALQQRDADHIDVRDSKDAGSADVGRAESWWKNDFLRLRLRGTDGRVFTTSRFHRIDSRAAPDALTRDTQSVAALDGSYRADVRNAAGDKVGWMRVRIDRDGHPVSRIYEGAVPPSIDSALVDAALVLLNEDIDAIERRALL